MKLRILCALSLVWMVGCNEVEERLAWSPDGKQAVLRVDDKLYLMDANGRLSEIIASNVTGAAWLPDSRGLVLVRSLPVSKWKDAESLLPADEIVAVQTLAKTFLALGPEGAEQFEPKRPELASPAILYLLDTQSNALHEALQRSKDPAKLEADLSNSRTTQVSEVSLVALDGKPLRVIERTRHELDQPRPSPTAPVVAFMRGDTLTVAPLDGDTNRVAVTEKGAGFFDWTADGRSLVYAVRQGEQFAGISRRDVFDTNGVLADGETTLLALNASTFTPRVRCLAGGQVLFAGMPLQLPGPAGAADMARFFTTVGTNAMPVAVPSAPGSLPQDLAAFAPNPDGRQVAIVESGSDAVAVLDVRSGEVEVVSPKRGWKSRMLPAWRGNDELYFAALPASSTNRPELFRWRKGSAPQAISTNWPDAVVNTLLEKPSK